MINGLMKSSAGQEVETDSVGGLLLQQRRQPLCGGGGVQKRKQQQQQQQVALAKTAAMNLGMVAYIVVLGLILEVKKQTELNVEIACSEIHTSKANTTVVEYLEWN